jgi:peptide chain release factor 1
MRLRRRVADPFDSQRVAPRHLLCLPPVLYGQAEDDRHCRSRRAVPSEIRRRREEDHLSVRARLAAAVDRAAAVERELSDPRTVRDAKLLASLGREHQRLLQIVALSNRFQKADDELSQAKEFVNSDDHDFATEARSEVERLERLLVELEAQAKPLLIPPDPLSERSCIMEIRAGTGGDEAALFAADLLRMYTRYIERKGWKIEMLEYSNGTKGGVKEAVMKIDGNGAFGEMHWESGVHRVQRVPETEAAGRIHTSAATVAVLPEAEEVDVEIDDKDLRVDVYRASGPGGQGVNTTDSAVRLTHLPTGIVVTQQDQRSQLQNKIKAMGILRAKILDARVQAQQAERARIRKSQVSTGDRSAKIRTYNFPQSRVTDHRINLTMHDLPRVMDGDVGKLIDALRMADTEERLREEE